MCRGNSQRYWEDYCRDSVAKESNQPMKKENGEPCSTLQCVVGVLAGVEHFKIYPPPESRCAFGLVVWQSGSSTLNQIRDTFNKVRNLALSGSVREA